MVCKQNFNRKLFHEKYQVFTIVLQCSYYISCNMSTNMCDVTKGVCGGGGGGEGWGSPKKHPYNVSCGQNWYVMLTQIIAGWWDC